MTGLIVQEWIERSGGAEQVLDAFRVALPDSRVYALWSDDPKRFAPGDVDESWMARTPLRRHKALGLPMMPATWKRAGVREQPEWVLTSSYVFAHHCDFGTRSSGVPEVLVRAHARALPVGARARRPGQVEPPCRPRAPRSSTSTAVRPRTRAISPPTARSSAAASSSRGSATPG